MPEINVKRFNELVSKLEKLADGVKLHSAETNFPANLQEGDFRSGKSELEDKRQAYDEAMNRARQIYDAYEVVYNSWKDKVANSNTMLYGFYGKKNQMLADFGLTPFKTHSAKGPGK